MKIAVMSAKTRELIFEGELLVDGKVNPEIPEPVRAYIGNWEPGKDPEADAEMMRYLKLRLPGSMALFFRGYVVKVRD